MCMLFKSSVFLHYSTLISTWLFKPAKGIYLPSVRAEAACLIYVSYSSSPRGILESVLPLLSVSLMVL